MTIEECREKGCSHVSLKRRRRNCGIVDCYGYTGFFEKRWFEEEYEEFDNCEDEE